MKVWLFNFKLSCLAYGKIKNLVIMVNPSHTSKTLDLNHSFKKEGRTLLSEVNQEQKLAS